MAMGVGPSGGGSVNGQTSDRASIGETARLPPRAAL